MKCLGKTKYGNLYLNDDGTLVTRVRKSVAHRYQMEERTCALAILTLLRAKVRAPSAKSGGCTGSSSRAPARSTVTPTEPPSTAAATTARSARTANAARSTHIYTGMGVQSARAVEQIGVHILREVFRAHALEPGRHVAVGFRRALPVGTVVIHDLDTDDYWWAHTDGSPAAPPPGAAAGPPTPTPSNTYAYSDFSPSRHQAGNPPQERTHTVNEQTTKPDVIANSATDILTQIRDGELMMDIADELTRVTEAVRETGKKGSVTIKLQIQPAAGGDATKVLVHGGCEAKPPKPSIAPSLFYTTERGALLRENPNQLKLHFSDDQE